MNALQSSLLLAVSATVAFGAAPQTNGDSSVMETPVACPSKSAKARALYNQGTTLGDSGDTVGASQAYRKALELDPKYCDAMDNLGLILRKDGKVDEAIGWYKKSKALNQKNVTARMNLAVAYRMKGQLSEAADEYTGLAALEPENPEGPFGLGCVLVDMGKNREALTPLKESERLYVAVHSEYINDARTMLARAHFAVEEWEPAVKNYQAVYEDNAGDAKVNLNLGISLVKLGKLKDAKKYLQKARNLGADVPPDIAKLAGI